MIAEREVQPWFSFLQTLQIVVLAAAIFASGHYLVQRPNRVADGPPSFPISFTAVSVPAVDRPTLKLVGAWEVAADDPRFGGFSGLAVDGGNLLALTDRGLIVRLGKPAAGTQSASIRDLPGGPDSPRSNRDRDTEALARDPLGRGWWVAFEKHHELWLFDLHFRRALKRVQLGKNRWPDNLGIEGLIAREGPELLLFGEADRRLFAMRDGNAVARTIAGLQLQISEAARLSDGTVVAIERGVAGIGLRNNLAHLEITASGYRVARRMQLPVGRLDNIEGMAVETLPGGSDRLWLISDDNFQRPMRTLLLAVDLPLKRNAD